MRKTTKSTRLDGIDGIERIGLVGLVCLVGLAMPGTATADYPACVLKTPGLQAYWQFEEKLDPRLEVKDKKSLQVDQEALRGLFFPGGSSLKVSARLVDASGMHCGRTEEVRTGEKGFVGSGLGFSGGDSLVYLFRDPVFESGTGDFAIEMWLKPDKLEADCMLAERMPPLCKGNGGWYVYVAKGSISFSVRRWAGENFSVVTPEGTLKMGVWQHLVCLRAGSNIKLYLNGAEVVAATCPSGFRIPDYGDMNLGGTPWGNRYVGSLDEFAYYSMALSPDTVKEHYAAGIKNDAQ